jgi:hypothetical protein
MLRRFELHRDEDPGGVSGIGVVADGVAFPDDVVLLRWRGPWPTSICWYDRGVAAVEHIHGHDGRTRIVWLDPGLTVDAVGACLAEHMPCICSEHAEDPYCRHHETVAFLNALAEAWP